MRSFNQILMAFIFIFPTITNALDINADFLYWQASESAEWALTNNLNSSQQVLSYQTIGFNFSPGFRVAVAQDYHDWRSRFIYTHFNTEANDSVSGTIIPAFEAGKFTQKFSNSAQVNFGINYNILEADFFQEIKFKENILFHPIIGLKGGWINQNIHTYFQGQINYTETLENYFKGIGPKIGIDSQWLFSQRDKLTSSLFANLSTAFLWGDWFLSDSLIQHNSTQVNQLLVGKRDFGAFMVDANLGFKFIYQNNMLKIAYEVADWFNQYQVFDNTTGARNNDLILQGLTVGISHYF